MVVSAEVIRSQQVFHVAWVLGTGDMHRKLTRKEILGQNLSDICDSIIELVPEKGVGSSKKAGLYILAMLTHGTVLIHRVQVDFLQKDVEKLKEIVRRKSFVILMAEKFDRELELKSQQTHGRDGKMRSEPILSIEDIDDLVDLENLQMISDQLGINVDPKEITMLDALPNFQSDWYQSGDFAALYGSVGQFSSEKENRAMYSTFVEGHASDDRRGDIVPFVEDIQTRPKDLSGSKSLKRRSSFVAAEEASLRTDFEKSTVQDKQVVEEVPKEREPEESFQQEENFQFAQCPLITTLAQETQEARPAFRFEDLDFENTPVHQKDKVSALQDNVTPLLPEQDVTIPLFPPVSDVVNLTDLEPPAKKQRLENGEENEDSEVERARRRGSSRPVTPVNQTNLTNLTNLNATGLPAESLVLDIDSQIHQAPPQRKRFRRNLPPIYGDDLEIDVAVQKTLLADWSSLVRKKEDVMPKILSKNEQIIAEMLDPAPLFTFRRKMGAEFREMFRSARYNPEVGTGVSSDEDESDEEEEQRTMEQEKFAQKCLLSSPARIPEEQRPLQIEEIEFEMPFRPQERELEPLKYAVKCLLATPEKRLQEEIAKELDLEPLPMNNIELMDFSHQQQTMPHNENIGMTAATNETPLEALRRRQKSSLGVRGVTTDELEEGDGYREKALERERQMRIAMDAPEDEELFVFSSGPLLLHNRRQIHRDLLAKAEEAYPEWMDFNKFTAKYSRKEATTSFEGLLLGLKNLKVRVKQEEPFGTILVQHVIREEE